MCKDEKAKGDNEMLSLAERLKNNSFLNTYNEYTESNECLPSIEEYNSSRNFFKKVVEPINKNTLRKIFEEENKES